MAGQAVLFLGEKVSKGKEKADFHPSRMVCGPITQIN